MKTLHPDLFPETLLVSREGERIFTTSRKVAEHFHKNHQHVLRNIEKLLVDLESDSSILRSQTESDGPKLDSQTEFSRLNFKQSDYKNSRGKTYPMFKLTEEAFALLAMGFTGKEALAWKVQFLSAFRDMERQIVAQQKRESNALFLLRPKWGPIVARPDMRREQLIGLTGHRSPNSITACRRRMRDIGLIN